MEILIALLIGLFVLVGVTAYAMRNNDTDLEINEDTRQAEIHAKVRN